MKNHLPTTFDLSADEDLVPVGFSLFDAQDDLQELSDREAWEDSAADMEDGWMEGAYDDLSDLGDDY